MRKNYFGKALIFGISILIFTVFVYAQGIQESSLLVPAEILEKILSKLEIIEQAQKEQSKILSQLDRVLAGQEEIKKELEMIRVRTFRK